jgi:nuclear transport factor 2 (NTF2) superfamily protein
MEGEYKDILRRAYRSFNNRNINDVLSLMIDGVRWPNGWEGGYVNGKEEVKEYWTRQWQQLNPIVEPIEFNQSVDGRIQVNVHQLVRNLTGEVIFDGQVNHVYRFQNGLIAEMEIR